MISIQLPGLIERNLHLFPWTTYPRKCLRAKKWKRAYTETLKKLNFEGMISH